MIETAIKVTAVIPALNEEKNIAGSVARALSGFNRYNLEGTIVVVNDGSTDSTAELAAELAKSDPRITLVSHETPRGIGGAFWTGTDNAQGDFVVMIPGDNESDPWEIFRYSHLLHHVDIVNPFVFNRGMRPWYRELLSRAYTLLINTTFGLNLHYTNGTVLYRKSLLQTLRHRDNSFFYQTDILIRLIRRQYLFAEVPYRLDLRRNGTTKALSLKSLGCVAGGYLRLLRDLYFPAEPEPEFTRDSQTYARRQFKT
ncbi:MAG: glycosyltransferase family 2 protein [Elusimicrobiaceae bacterium]|nr:glycosyltransferase family 2 protein [Elusimicrobiaceae bacterium]